MWPPHDKCRRSTTTEQWSTVPPLDSKTDTNHYSYMFYSFNCLFFHSIGYLLFIWMYQVQSGQILDIINFSCGTFYRATKSDSSYILNQPNFQKFILEVFLPLFVLAKSFLKWPNLTSFHMHSACFFVSTMYANSLCRRKESTMDSIWVAR